MLPLLKGFFVVVVIVVATMHTTQKDTTYTKIFVGGLPYHTTDSSLRKYFEVFGEIEEAVVITDRQTGKSRGYGFVSIDSSASLLRTVFARLSVCLFVLRAALLDTTAVAAAVAAVDADAAAAEDCED